MFVRTMNCKESSEGDQSGRVVAWDYGLPDWLEFSSCELTDCVWLVPGTIDVVTDKETTPQARQYGF